MKVLPKQERILIVDDEEKIRGILAVILKDAGYTIETAKDGFDALEKSVSFKPQVLIVDLQMPRLDGIETIMRIKERSPQAVGIILTAHGTIQSAVQAIKGGVYDYITKPFDNEQILLVVKRALDVFRLTEEVDELKKELQKKYGIENILGESSLLQAVKHRILQMAQTDATVLIEGESGTGKELAARAIHFESKRKNNPLTIVDCTSIPTNLIESEFFGHERGAFTDARERKIGRFEEADSGTIFLDEIGELPLEAQTKLLRVLQEKEFSRLGGTVPIKVDVRVIAATNKNLEKQVELGRFREDLYYRLNVLKLRMPALREHQDDIPLYIDQFLRRYGTAFGKSTASITPEALQLFKHRDWKGNIRELENAIQRALLNTTRTSIGIEDLEFLALGSETIPLAPSPAQGLEPFIKSLTERSERELIIKALEETHWNRTEAAAKLKISRKTLFNKMQQYGLGESSTL
ncbi:MAG: sigma-54 dependent transcriptional regulator [Bacteroidota bacterium]|jgi:DNA-binding NtrC family response regulator